MKVRTMQIQDPGVALSSCSPGDTAVLMAPDAGHGSLVLVVGGVPALPAGSVAVVYLQDGTISYKSQTDLAVSVPYKAVPV